MGTPTRLSERLAEIVERHSQPAERKTRTCHKHGVELEQDPRGVPQCPECRDERDRQLTEQRRRKVEADLFCDLPTRYFDVEPDHPEVLKWLDECDQEGNDRYSLLLLGPTGTGKTHQAYGAFQRYVTRNLCMKWFATTHADLVASLRPGADPDGRSPEELIRDYIKAEILLIDDLGAIKMTEFSEEITYRIVNGRYNDMAPTIYTSNLPVAELRNVIGDRVASRIAEESVHVVLSGPDRRRTKKGKAS